ncbi:MAG: hypothetical protein L6R40_007959 [Gallowayella cf. fulva]|nr:MAG: hypothetical protein L6R40_007959 [Xanthomendoza cf. fulva]
MELNEADDADNPVAIGGAGPSDPRFEYRITEQKVPQRVLLSGQDFPISIPSPVPPASPTERALWKASDDSIKEKPIAEDIGTKIKNGKRGELPWGDLEPLSLEPGETVEDSFEFDFRAPSPPGPEPPIPAWIGMTTSQHDREHAQLMGVINDRLRTDRERAKEQRRRIRKQFEGAANDTMFGEPVTHATTRGNRPSKGEGRGVGEGSGPQSGNGGTERGGSDANNNRPPASTPGGANQSGGRDDEEGNGDDERKKTKSIPSVSDGSDDSSDDDSDEHPASKKALKRKPLADLTPAGQRGEEVVTVARRTPSSATQSPPHVRQREIRDMGTNDQQPDPPDLRRDSLQQAHNAANTPPGGVNPPAVGGRHGHDFEIHESASDPPHAQPRQSTSSLSSLGSRSTPTPPPGFDRAARRIGRGGRGRAWARERDARGRFVRAGEGTVRAARGNRSARGRGSTRGRGRARRGGGANKENEGGRRTRTRAAPAPAAPLRRSDRLRKRLG